MPPRDSRTVSDIRRQKRASVAGKWLREHQQAQKQAETKRRYVDVVKKGATREATRQGEVAAAKTFQTAPGERKAPPKGYKPINERKLVEATGVPQMVRDAKWAATHPVERLTGKGKAAGAPIMFQGKPATTTVGEFPGFSGKVTGAIGRKILEKVAPGKAAAKAAAKAAVPKVAPPPTAGKPITDRPLPAVRTGAPPPAKGRTGDLLPPQASAVIASLPKAKELRLKQEKLYSAERASRAGKAEAAMQVGGRAGYHAALHELKGELPKLKFGALEHFDQQAADELFTHVQQHPDLRPYEKIGTQTALTKVLSGAVPTRGEIKLLHRTFGPEIATQIAESIPFWAKARDRGIQVLNVPRSLMASMDLSAPFRQGLVLGARHPVMFAKEFAPMLKSFKSEHAYEGVMDEIASRPTFETMQKSGLKLTDLQGLADREEQFMSNLAETVTGGKRSPVRMSGRAYTGFLNKFRADAFDNYLKVAERQGLDIKDEQVLKSISRWVNHATGRGSIKSLEGAMVPLNTLLFSPRLIASRLQLLNPVFYAKLDPFARKQALQGMAQLAGAMSLTLYLAKQAGAEVGLDPRSSDFGKIKVGDTRVDIGGGLLQYIVAGNRLRTGETVSSTTGEVTKLQGGFAKPSRADILSKFVQNKLAPVPGFATHWAQNETFAGTPFNPVTEGAKLFVPLGAEQAYEARSNPGAAGVSLGLNAFGFGTQTYGPTPAGSKSKSVWGDAGGAKKTKSVWGSSSGASKSKSLWP